MTQNTTRSATRFITTAKSMLCKPVLISLLALSSVTAYAEVCPADRGTLETVTIQGGFSDGEALVCNYTDSNGDKSEFKKGAKNSKFFLNTFEITPVIPGDWNGDNILLCDASKSDCEFNLKMVLKLPPDPKDLKKEIECEMNWNPSDSINLPDILRKGAERAKEDFIRQCMDK